MPRTISTRLAGTIALFLSALVVAGCAGNPSSQRSPERAAARVGVDPVPLVHLLENHSSALIAWRRAGARDRVLVHFDGHADLDWIPDDTVARIAAIQPEELETLELHPYALDATVHQRFAIWNFIYPAARLGMVRELVWVVPDGTLEDTASANRLFREILIDKLEMISLEEAQRFQAVGRTIRGQALGLPVLICELADLPAIDEPVLLDLDLDYFTTASAITMQVTRRPRISPEDVLLALQERGIRTDLATISLSTIGGYMPAVNRWMGHYLQDRLRDPSTEPGPWEAIRREAVADMAEGQYESAIARFREIVEASPDDAGAWYGMSLALADAGEESGASAARDRAVGLDPILEHDGLFEGDRLWLNHEYEAALALLRTYVERHPDGPFTAHAHRRIGGCLMRLRRDDEAIEAYEETIARAPEHGDTLLDLAILYRARGDVSKAISLLSRARRSLPDRATYAMALGRTYVLAGRLEEGAAELRDAVERRPCSARARRGLAATLAQLGRNQEALEHFQIAVGLAPADPQNRMLAAQMRSAGIHFVDAPPPTP